MGGVVNIFVMWCSDTLVNTDKVQWIRYRMIHIRDWIQYFTCLVNISHSCWLLATKHTSCDYRDHLPHDTHLTEAENARYLFSQPPLWHPSCGRMIQALPAHLPQAVTQQLLVC